MYIFSAFPKYLYCVSSNLLAPWVHLCVLCVSVSCVAGRLKPADTGTLLPALNYLYCSLSSSPTHCTDRGDWHPPTPHRPPNITLILSGSPWRHAFRAFTDRREDRTRERSRFFLPASESHPAIKEPSGILRRQSEIPDCPRFHVFTFARQTPASHD